MTMNQQSTLKTTAAAAEGIAIEDTLAKEAEAETAEARPAFRHPKVILSVPTPESKYQRVQPRVPDTQLTREATGLLHEFSTPLLFNHSHRVFFWANELGRQSGQKYDQELLFIS